MELTLKINLIFFKLEAKWERRKKDTTKKD
jgi:hypothetical protein